MGDNQVLFLAPNKKKLKKKERKSDVQYHINSFFYFLFLPEGKTLYFHLS